MAAIWLCLSPTALCGLLSSRRGMRGVMWAAGMRMYMIRLGYVLSWDLFNSKHANIAQQRRLDCVFPCEKTEDDEDEERVELR